MEKIKLSYKGTEISIYDTPVAYRLEEETYPEYKQRQKVLSDLERAKKRQRNMLHVSVMFIPAMNEEGKILKDPETNEIKWIGKTKGKTYIKSEYKKIDE